MRHQKAGRALGVTPAHRRAMLRNLVTSLLEHQQIKTTITRAKEMRTPLDKMITLGKKGDLPARRRALSFVKSKQAMANLFGEFAERYKERNGGYSRIIPLGPRRGDGADMAMIVLVDSPDDPLAGEQKPARQRRRPQRKPKQPAQETAAAAATEAAAAPAEAAAEVSAAPAEAEAEGTTEAETTAQADSEAAPAAEEDGEKA